jgi:hypothetical protein
VQVHAFANGSAAMKKEQHDRTGDKPARKFAVFPMLLAAAAVVAVVIYLVVSSPGASS